MVRFKGIQIISDGSPGGTKVLSADGEDLTRKLEIRSIDFHQKAGELPTATLVCFASIKASIQSEDLTEEILEFSKIDQEFKKYRKVPDAEQSS